MPLFSGAICNQGGEGGVSGCRGAGAGQLRRVSGDRLRRVMGTMPALMGSSRGARPSLFLPTGPRAAEIKRKRRERRFDSNTKQIIPPGMEQNKSEWSLMAVIPPCQATAGGPGLPGSAGGKVGGPGLWANGARPGVLIL